MTLSLPSRTAAETIQLIKQGQRSPYTGILMGEEEFRYFKVRELEADSLSEAFVKGPPPSDESGVVYFAIPLILGLLVGGFVVDTLNRK